MATRQVSVFLTPKEGTENEAQVTTFPDPVIANIIQDEETGELIEIDEVIWEYVTQTPAESPALVIAQPPAPEQVFIEIRFAPLRTPFPQPQIPSSTSAWGPTVEAISAGYGSVGTVPIAPNAPRLDAATASDGEPQQTEQEGGFEFRIREYKYAVVLTTGEQVYALDPRLKIRHRNRRA